MRFFRRKPDHEPDEVALVMDVTGWCRRCSHHTTARLTAYWDRSIIISCNNCKGKNTFEMDEESWTSAKGFLPWRGDEDDTEK